MSWYSLTIVLIFVANVMKEWQDAKNKKVNRLANEFEIIDNEYYKIQFISACAHLLFAALFAFVDVYAKSITIYIFLMSVGVILTKEVFILIAKKNEYIRTKTKLI